MGDPFHEITGLAVDYLNNHIDPPHAFSIQSGSLYSYEEAQFHVYGLTQYPLYYQVTEMFLPCPTGKSTGVVQVKQGPGSRSVAGRVKVVNVDGNLIVTYRPNRKSNVHRTAILTFTYDAGYKSPLTTQFSLDIFPSS